MISEDRGAEVDLVEVTKRYGAVEACSGVNLRIPEGEFVTLLGPSGCGKSTTLNMIAGLEEITAGDILMDGQRVNDLTPYERDVAMVFQQYALYPHMTVAENIGFTMKLRRRPKAEIAAKVGAVAELLELSPYLDRLPRELSGGQQQRVALGRAIIREPRVFLFDEPFSNLDAALRLKMRAEIKLLHSRLGVTSIFVTHDQEEALSISDRIAVMRQGRVEQYGTPEEVYARPATTYVARFIGSPPMDILHGEIISENGSSVYRVGAAAFPLPERTANALRAFSSSRGINLGVRSEHVLLAPPGDEVTATVQVVQPLGPSTVVTAAWDGGALTARVQGIAALPPGETVGLRLDPAGLLFFDRETGLRLEA
ncbi:MAG: sn-glycerol-3-phosphate transporter ATP-binding protein UgpC [Thermomicrobiales bacterium]|jgi:ABC-type sugar transport system ATPase subunit|nr:sn-glycerol-3-phosphate transporter ATP-binding protein UgpC [Thermomicrobiales bacterium]